MIKYFGALIGGAIVGAVLLAAAVYINPMVSSNNLSPLSVTDNEVMRLSFSTAAKDAFIYTNDGESQITPHPAKVLQLWEPTIRRTTAMATTFENSRGEPAGFGIKFSSDSERTNPLSGEVLVNSVWHIYLPERGSMFIEQSENYWNYIHEIVVPAYRSSGDSWRGNWFGNMTAGPGALGTARVAGGSGQFATMNTEAVEALSAKAYSVADGPVAVRGYLSVELIADEDPEQPQDQ